MKFQSFATLLIPGDEEHYNNATDGFFHIYLIVLDILEVWRNADAVCFDVDSTVCIDEGIDELAEFCGAGEAVAEWTARSSCVLFMVFSLI